MADTAHSTAAAQNANLKDTRPAGRLLTPELTPGVEDGMIAAELARRAAENRHLAASSTDSARQTTDSPDDETKGLDGEVERIMKCYKDSHAEILAVDPSSSDVDRLAAWRRLGCMTHPHYCQHKKAKDAFKKVQDAARKMGVDQPFIDEVNLWNGKTDLQADEDSDGEEAEDDAAMEEGFWLRSTS